MNSSQSASSVIACGGVTFPKGEGFAAGVKTGFALAVEILEL